MTLRDIFYNSEYGVGRGILTRSQAVGDGVLNEGSGWLDADTMADVAGDATLMDEFTSSQTTYNDAADSQAAFKTLAANTVSMSRIADSDGVMNAVANSQPAVSEVFAAQVGRDEVTTSTLAMDAVAATQTGRDAIGTSGDSYTAVRSSDMAFGKYVAGAAGLTPDNYADIDAVTSDAAAVDAVVASNDAVDIFNLSVENKSILLGANGGSSGVFSNQYPSTEFYSDSIINPNSGSVESLPYTYTGSGNSNADHGVSLSDEMPSELSGGKSIQAQNGGREASSQQFAKFNLDLTNVSDLEYWALGNGNYVVLYINDSSIAFNTDVTSWTKYTTDVSGYSGVTKIGLGTSFSEFSGPSIYYTGFNLI